MLCMKNDFNLDMKYFDVSSRHPEDINNIKNASRALY